MNLFSEIALAAIIGITGGLIGIFYRNCMKPSNMIFSWWYDILDRWVSHCDSYDYNTPVWVKIKKWIAYPLGYCVYCTSTWITFMLYSYISGMNIWIVLATAIQHLVVVACCRFLIKGNKDLKYKR